MHSTETTGGSGGGTDDKWAALREHCSSGKVKQRSFTGCHDGSMMFSEKAAAGSGTATRRRVKTHSMPALHEAFQERGTSVRGQSMPALHEGFSDNEGLVGGDRWAALRNHCDSGRVKQRSFAGTDHKFFRGNGEPEGVRREFSDPGMVVEGGIRREEHRPEAVRTEERKAGEESDRGQRAKDEKDGAKREKPDEVKPATAPAETGCQCILL